MMRLLLFLSLFSSILEALTLSDALVRAKANNPLIKEQKHRYEASKAHKQSAIASFLPSLDLAYGYDKFSIANFVGQTASSSASSTLSYNLFNGFKDSALLQSAQAKSDVQKHQGKAALEDLKLRVTLNYINCLRRVKEIEIAKDRYTLLEKQYHDAKNFQEQGVFAHNEVLQVHVELLTARQNLLLAKQNIKISRAKLKREMGGFLGEAEQLESLQKSKLRLDYKSLELKMYNNRSELKLLKAQERDFYYQYKALAGDYYPAVNVKVKYQAAGNEIIPGEGESFLRNDEKSVGLSMSWNLYKGGKTQDERVKLYELYLAARAKVEDISLQLSLQLTQTFQNIKLAYSQIEVAALGLEQAQENFRIVNEQFQLNIASTLLLLQAQRVLTEAKVSYHNASYKAYDTMATLQRVVEEEL